MLKTKGKMRRNLHKGNKKIVLNKWRNNKVLASCGVFSGAFMMALVASSIFAPANTTNADTVAFNVTSTGYYVNLTSSGSITLDATATPDGAVAIVKDPLTVTTNSKTGYKLYLSMDNSNTNGNRLYIGGDSTSSSYLSPTTGTVATPAALDTNSWGFAVPGLTGFDSVYVDSAGNSSDGQTGQTLNASNRFAAVPLANAETLISQTDGPNTTGVKTDVYYGVNVATSMTSGTYQGTLVYSILAEGSNNIYGDASIAPNATTNLSGGDTVTVGTSLFASNVSTSEVTVTIGGQPCTVTGTSNPNGAGLTITCVTPNLGALGDYDVIVQIPKYDRTYILTGGYHIYKPINQVTTMQEFTQYNCSQLTKPAALDGSGKVVPTTAASEKTLTDSRDNNQYRIRRLADGNCWMTQNLRLRLTAGQALTNQNTDLNSRTSWTPTRTTQTTTGTKWGSNGSAGTTGTTNDQYAAVEHSYWDNLQLTTLDSDTQYRGTYYNWYTATAMSGTWSMGDGSPADAPDSVCPKGWRLPPNSGDKSFQNLIVTTYQLLTTPGDGNASARNALMKNPFSYTYSGVYNWTDGNIYSGSHATFWSSEAYATTSARILTFNSTGYVSPQTGHHKPYGLSVRCVLR